MRRATAKRDRAIILTLRDSGLRASELGSLTVADYNQKTGRLEVKHGVRGGAKGGKGRFVFLGKSARSAMWRYRSGREELDDAAPLFFAKYERPMNKNA